MCSGQLLERRRLDVVGARDHDLRGRDGPERRRPLAALDERPGAEDRAWADLGHGLTVDLDAEDPVEQEVDAVALVALFGERLVDLELPAASTSRRCA